MLSPKHCPIRSLKSPINKYISQPSVYLFSQGITQTKKKTQIKIQSFTTLLFYKNNIFTALLPFNFFYSLWNDLTWRFHTFQWALKTFQHITFFIFWLWEFFTREKERERERERLFIFLCLIMPLIKSLRNVFKMLSYFHVVFGAYFHVKSNK